jgi:pilus assembly protein Flp/PilA
MFELVQKKYLELRNSEAGQTLAEYAILLALIAIVVIAAVLLLGPTISSVFLNINTQLKST